MRTSTSLSKTANERTFLIASGNWFHKRIQLTNTEASGLTDRKIKLEVITEGAPIRSAKRKQITRSLRQNQLEKERKNTKIIISRKRHTQEFIPACG
jgi:hypothetical protein